MMTSEFRPELEIWPFCTCTMHPAIIRLWNSSVIVDLAMGQIPHSTEHMSSLNIKWYGIKLQNKICFVYV